jgi:hypothetical protein
MPDTTIAMKPPRNRPSREYHAAGSYALQNAIRRVGEGQDWTEALGPVGEALRAWRDDLVEALGGRETTSPQKCALVEVATRTHLMLESVDSYILAMPSLVNKSKRQLFAVVRERTQLADALARYLAMLGLDRVPPRQKTLMEVLRERDEAKQKAAAQDTQGVEIVDPEGTQEVAP